jgi:hypothetical protein
MNTGSKELLSYTHNAQREIKVLDMAATIFYSWQSDLPNNINRSFIEKALIAAIKQIGRELNIEEAARDKEIVLDKDTKGVPGIPPIAQVILDKISNCGIFVPDVTFVGKSVVGRPVPNPNVLIEYGWALKSIGHNRIIPVINTFYGEPTEANLPFDMRHLRRPLTYHLNERANDEERRRVKETLVKELANAIRLVIDSGLIEKEEAGFFEIPSTTNPSTFLRQDEMVGIQEDRFGPEGHLKLPETQRLFLRLIPTKAVPVIKSSKLALDMVRSGGLAPLTYGGGGISTGRNKYGAFVCSKENDIVHQMTQLFKDQELWGIDAELLDRKMFRTSFSFFPFVPFESTFKISLKNYLTFASDTLKLPLPLRFIAGATDVEGYRMEAPPNMTFGGFEKYAGTVVDQHIIYEGLIESYDIKVSEVLRPFFEKVWEECGLKRSDID